MSALHYFHNPESIAVIGASNDPDKIGGRPIAYMRRYGFTGNLYPINPNRPEIQGLRAYASLDELPEIPDVIVVAVAGASAVAQITRAAQLGVKGCVIMSSGFGETGDEQGLAWQREMIAAASQTGMRLVGPNAQGLASFHSGAVLSFSTLFTEQPPEDGPVAIVSQSGAMCSVPYGLLREAGIGVRYAHGTGNDIDVTAAELAATAVADPAIQLLLMYLEDFSDLDSIAEVARVARERDVPVVVLKGGRSEAGQKAAASHTGALATEERVVDAFLEKHGIWRARSTHDLVAAVPLYLRRTRPRGERLAIVSNSGAICVLSADAAADNGLSLATLSSDSRTRLRADLPHFASVDNPIDVTAALLTDSSLFGKVLPVLADDDEVDAVVLGIPVAGRGYDVDRFAADVAEFEDSSGVPVVLAVPQKSVAQVFKDAGAVVFADESQAVGALAQYLRHHERMRRAAARGTGATPRRSRDEGPRVVLNEARSLEMLASVGVPVVEHAVVNSAADAAAAFSALGGNPVVVKGCSSEVTHKSELGLVKVGISDSASATRTVQTMLDRMGQAGVANEGVILATMVESVHEAMLGARLDPVFGPVVLVGAGGIYLEEMPDVQFLLPPFDVDEALAAIGRLRISAVLGGARGRPPVDVRAWAEAAVRVGELMLDGDRTVLELDVNPLMLLAAKGRTQPAVRAVDAVVILEGATQ